LIFVKGYLHSTPLPPPGHYRGEMVYPLKKVKPASGSFNALQFVNVIEQGRMSAGNVPIFPNSQLALGNGLIGQKSLRLLDTVAIDEGRALLS